MSFKFLLKLKDKFVKNGEIPVDLEYYRSMQNVSQSCLIFIDSLTKDADEKELEIDWQRLQADLIKFVPYHTGNSYFARSIEFVKNISNCSRPILRKINYVKWMS